jgi:hypothetical protein
MTNFKITAPEARRAAELVSMFRSRSGGVEWHKPGIEDALMKHADMADAPELVVAMIRACLEPVNRTPAIIGHPGPHWKAADAPVVYVKPRPDQRCAVCQAADGPAHPVDHEWMSPASSPRRTGKQALIEQVRAMHEEGRSKLCRHGALVCKLCDEERDDPDTIDVDARLDAPASSDPSPVAP